MYFPCKGCRGQISLDEITGRETHKQEHIEITKSETKSSSAQKIIGYILFAFSLLVGLILLIWGYNPGDYIILLPIALSFLISGLLCLFAGKKAFYWCIWTALAPLVVLIPFLVGLSFLPVLSVSMLIVFVIMLFVANIVFKDTIVKTSAKKTVLLVLSWILPLAIYVLEYYICTMPMPSYLHRGRTVGFCPRCFCRDSLSVDYLLQHRFLNPTSDVVHTDYNTTIELLLNFICYVLIALLETYTVCYVKNLRKK